MSHTPAPWVVDSLAGGIWAGTEETGHYVCPPDDMRPEDTNPADLRLIAAAPDLLEALLECLDFLPEDYPYAKVPNPLGKARAAIAKATGEVIALTKSSE